jgi:hypothetical protein
MKLADVDLEELILALGSERSAWVATAKQEGRQLTETELVTICVLHALANSLRRISQ